MAQTRERYRRLPGRRRGVWRGASVWMGADHLLLVNSFRFREEYKRFYLRDVQAIMVARRPRFHVSTRSCGLAALWAIAYFPVSRVPHGTLIMWSLAAALVAVWLFVSAVCSCTCRIFTAVSRDDLRSVYRTWTARRFLAKVSPRIQEVQGALESNWAEAAELSHLGPQPVPAAPAVPAASSQPGEATIYTVARPTGPQNHTPASDFFVLTLFVGALVDWLSLKSHAAAVPGILNGAAIVQVAASIVVMFQYHRGALRAAMLRLAIAALVVLGIGFYAAMVVAALANKGAMVPINTSVMLNQPGLLLFRQVNAGVGLLLGLIGVGIIVRGNQSGEPIS